MLILFIALLIALISLSELHLAGWRVHRQRQSATPPAQPTVARNTFRQVS